MTCTRAYFLVFLVSALAAFPASAQVAVGTPPFASFTGGPDIIDAANLNVHLTIPILQKAGRGLNFNPSLAYDSYIWYPVTTSGVTTWTPISNYGWSASAILIGHAGPLGSTGTLVSCPPGYALKVTYTNWTYFDGIGTQHGFPGTSQTVGGSCPSTTGFTSTASDGSGYVITVSGGTITSLYSSDGSLITPGSEIQDRNGNFVSVSANTFTDTLGTTALTISGSGTPSSPMKFTYTAPSGSSPYYAMNYTNYTLATNFGVSGINEFKSMAAVPIVTSIVLPGGSEYSFNYEATPGTCTPYSGTTCTTGRLASVTFPTGGTITYSYSGGNNGILSDGTAATLTRATPDTAGGNSWTYAHSESGTAWTTLITDPQGNQTSMNFQGIYQTEQQVFQGSQSSGTLLRQWTTCYNGNTSSCNGTAITLPITQQTVVDQYGSSGLQCKHNYLYNSVGGLTEEDDYDFGSGAPGALLRKTLITFASLGNITAFRQTVTICNGTGSSPSCNNTGTVVAQTNYNYDQTTPTTTSGIAQHTSVSGSRGNLTSINYPVSGITANITYYDTGSPNTSVDVNGAKTTYNYSSNTADCQMAFPTSVSEPLSMSRSMTWNCTGGVPATTTDENSNVTTSTWNDPYFWRPASINYPDGGLTSWTYASQTSVTTTTKMNSSQNIVTTQLLDGLGRNKEQQLNSDPEGVVYTDTAYDPLGRPYTVSNPYRSTSDPTYGLTTNGYDALSRPTSVTLQDGSVSNTSYANNTVTTTDPAGKKRTLTYNSLGFLTQVAEDPSGFNYPTAYTYDPLGDLLATSQSGSRQRAYTYDAMSRLTSESNPETGTITYGYDANGHTGDLTSRVAPAPNQTGSSSVKTTYTYDALHRLTSKSYSDGTTPTMNYGYDVSPSWISGLTNLVGRLVQAYNQFEGTNGKGTVTVYSYDTTGRIVQQWEQTPALAPGGDPLVYNYDLAGDQLTSTNGVGVTLTQMFDSAARPTQLTSTYVDDIHPATLATTDPSVGYYPFGALRKMVLGNSLTQATAFNKDLQLCRINVNSSGTTLGTCSDAIPSGNVQDHNYGFNLGSSNNGNVVSWVGTGTQSFNRSYTYDTLNRLSTLSSPSDPNGCTGLSWTYDAWGNRTDQTVTGGTCPSFHQTINTLNRLANSPYMYDAAGNLTADASHTYFYDAENRLAQVDGTFGTCSSATACYTYDALGRRVEKITGSTKVDYLYDLSGNAVTEWCTNCSGYTGWSKGYVYFNGSLAAEYGGSTYFVHADHLGSPRLLTSVGSNLIANPGFESGETNWNGWSSNITLVDSSSLCHSGSYCAQLSSSGTGGPSLVGQTLAVQPGDVLTFGGWVNLQSGGGGAEGWLIETQDSSHNAVNWIDAGNPATTSSWQFQTTTYTVPSGIAYVFLYATVWDPTSSTVLLVDDGFLYDDRTSLQIVQNLDYLPFGELNSSDSGVNTHEFTGLEHDAETNLDHTQFRKYSSAFGRWMTPDPAGLAAVDPTNPQTWNRYAYVLNNPLRFVDPLGLACVDGNGNIIQDDNGVDLWTDPVSCEDYGGGKWVDPIPSESVTVSADGPDDNGILDPLDLGGDSGGFFSGFTLGIRAPGQTYGQCLGANSSNYSIGGVVGTDNFLLSNDAGQLLFGNGAEGSAGLLVWEGGSQSFEAGVGTVMTAGRRTAAITSMNLGGVTGPAPRILAKTGAEEFAGWLSGAAELKMAADIGLAGAEAIGCVVPR